MSLMNFDEIPVLDRNLYYPIINGVEVKLDGFHPYTQYAIPFENGSLLITNTDAVVGLGWEYINMAIAEIADETLIENSIMKGLLWEGLATLDKGAPISLVGWGCGFLARTPEGGFNGMLSKDFHILTIRKEYDCANGCSTFATDHSASAIRSTIANIPFKQDAYKNMMSKYSIPYGHNDEIVFEGPVLIYGLRVIHGDYIHMDGTAGMPLGLQMEYQTVGDYNPSEIKGNYNPSEIKGNYKPSEIKPTHRTFLCD